MLAKGTPACAQEAREGAGGDYGGVDEHLPHIPRRCALVSPVAARPSEKTQGRKDTPEDILRSSVLGTLSSFLPGSEKGQVLTSHCQVQATVGRDQLCLLPVVRSTVEMPARLLVRPGRALPAR